MKYIQPLKMELIEGSETSENHNRTPGKYPKEYIQKTAMLLRNHPITLVRVVLQHKYIYTSPGGPGQRNRYADPLRAERSGDRIPLGIFRSPSNRCWGPPSLLYNEHRVSLTGVKRSGVGSTTYPHLVPRLKKEHSYTSGTPLRLYGQF